MEDERIFEEYLERWKACPDVRGVLVSGSRGAGCADEHSDYDLLIVVAEDAAATADNRLPKPAGKAFDLWFLPLSQLEEALLKPDFWAPGFMDSKVVFDKTGEIAQVIDRLGNLEPEKARDDTAGWFDAYLNAYYRSLKAARRGQRLGAHLQGTESMHHLIKTLFSLNERLPPYPDRLHLHWHRLKKTPYSLDDLKERIERILQTGSAIEQIHLEEAMEALLRAEGHGNVIDDWNGDLDLAKSRFFASAERNKV